MAGVIFVTPSASSHEDPSYFFRGGAVTQPGDSSHSKDDAQQHALTLSKIGVEQIVSGKVELAVATLDESLKVCPTAEGFTYRGWAASLLGEYNKAISYCHKAIRVDEQFGNPYNDIGVYLLRMGRLEEALTWLEKAKGAPRYEPRHFPYLNAGHIYLLLGEQNKALQEYVTALEIDPDNTVAKEAIAGMDMDFY